MKKKRDILFLCQFFYPEYISSAQLPYDTVLALRDAGFSVGALCGYPREYAEGMMQGMGNTMMPFVCSIAGMWGVRIVGTFICTQLLGMGLVSAWACMIAHNLLLFLLFAGYYISGKWNPMNRKNAVQSVKTAD